MSGGPRAAGPSYLRRLNERAVLAAIRASAPISRAQVSRETAISKPTVSVALDTLLAAGLVAAADPAPGRPHYGATYFEPVRDSALVLGVDVGTRFLRGALCDGGGSLVARLDREFAAADGDSLIDAVVALRDALVTAGMLTGKAITTAVVGVPGVVDAASESIRLAGEVAGLERLALGPALRRRLGIPVSVENDINLAALGEQWRGCAVGVDDFAFLSVGTGVGTGLVLGGRLHRGHHRAAGEIDYARALSMEEIDPSAHGVAMFAASHVPLGAVTAARPPFAAPALFAAARNGDRLAVDVVAETGRRIAMHVIPIAAVADPSLIVLGGGIGLNGDLLIPYAAALLRERLPFPPRLEVSTLGDAAILTGALRLGLDEALEQALPLSG